MTYRREGLRTLRASSVVTVASGAAVGQLIAIAAAPLLSRLYRPEEFGAFVVASSIALATGTIASFRLDLAIPLPEQDSDARALVGLGTCSAVVSCSALAGLAWCFRDEALEIFDGALGVGTLVGSFAVGLVVAYFRLASQWMVRRGGYRLIARRNVVQSLVTVVTQLAGGVLGWSAGLIAGFGAGQGAGAISLLRSSGLRRGGTSRWRSVARRYWRFPVHMTPAGILNVAGLYVPLILLAALFGPAVAGFVGFSQRVIGVPMTLVGQSVAQVYLGNLSEVHRRGDDGGPLFWVATRRLLAVAVPFSIALLVLGPWAFTLVFGAEWRPAGVMSQALGLAVAGQLVASTLSHTLIVYERTSLSLLWDATRLVLAVASVAIPHHLGMGAIATVWIYSGATLATYGLLWELARRSLDGGSNRG